MELAALVGLGLADGLNVCSLSLLVLFISLMYTVGASRRMMLLLGAIYILGVFIAYFTAGIGILLFSLAFPMVPHLLARISVGIMIFIGAVNILGYFYPNSIRLPMPTGLSKRAIRYMRNAGLPSAGAAGLIAGLHNFPCACTGGIYPVFISLIAGSSSGLILLILYNLTAVAPLITILYVCSSKPVTVKIRKWQQGNSPVLRLVLGIVMLVVGAAIFGVIVLGIV